MVNYNNEEKYIKFYSEEKKYVIDIPYKEFELLENNLEKGYLGEKLIISSLVNLNFQLGEDFILTKPRDGLPDIIFFTNPCITIESKNLETEKKRNITKGWIGKYVENRFVKLKERWNKIGRMERIVVIFGEI